LLLVAAAPLMAQSHSQHDMGQMNHGQMMQNSPANPYAEAEMQMHQRMMAAMGADPDGAWARKMIEHHRGAIEMSRILASRGSDRQLRAMAQRSSAQQRREIQELEAWLNRHSGRRR
jgi:uncharacterized protein (DUF305 family)